MIVLITGGAGFIGSHLAERCLKQGWAVRVLDDLSTGAEENLAHLLDHPAFSFVHGSVLDRRLLDEVMVELAGPPVGLIPHIYVPTMVIHPDCSPRLA